MIHQKPSIETILPNSGSSFTVRHFTKPNQENATSFWHMHPELELVYVNGGNGKRHIGNHLEYFSGGELVLIGSNLPHSGFSDRLNGGQKETVIQFLPHFLGADFFEKEEFKTINELFVLAGKGISFSKEIRAKLSQQIEQLIELNPFDRILSFLDILHQLATSKEYIILNANGVSLSITKQDNDRMRIIFNYVKSRFQEKISGAEIAQLVSLTEPSFSRYFKKSTGHSFVEFVNNYRLVHASKLLTESNYSISEVAIESGFNNFSHFNQCFQKKYGKSASKYRKSVQELLSA